MNLKAKIGSLALATLLTTTAISGAVPNALAKEKKTGNAKRNQPKNVIVLIGDGMGPEFNSAYRHYQDNPRTKAIERTAFDHYLVGQMSTDPDNGDRENITDSAAAGTALATGTKTYNGAIGVDTDKERLETVLEAAKKKKKATGLVVTSELTDATPSAYAAHEESRNSKKEIAQDFYRERIKNQHKVDVLLGGGAKYFGKNNKNLAAKFKKDGYDVVSNKKQLLKSKKKQILGTFAEENLPYKIDRTKTTPSLREMTEVALEKLDKNKKGFFLMVEGSQIDKAAHPNDVTGVMSEMEDFDKAFQAAIKFAKQDGNTLVITTADHATGGLTLGSAGVQSYNPGIIHEMKASPVKMAQRITAGEDVDKVIDSGYGFDLTTAEIDKIKAAAKKPGSDDYKVQSAVEAALTEPVNTRTHTGWTTSAHVGHDVNVYGYGPGLDAYRGVIDNTDVANNIFNYYR